MPNLKEKVIFNWSGGKDSALALHKILQAKQYDVQCLLTSISEPYQRISMHGVRVELLYAQTESIGIPLVKLLMPEMANMENYEQRMRDTLTPLKNQGATTCIFGDIFLEDLRQYRESKLAELNLKAVFPLWKQPTKELLLDFLDLGFKTITTCVNEKYLDKSFVGQVIDRYFINSLPKNVDSCGENGEFHTFVFDGPIFKKPVAFSKGEIVYRKYTAQQEDNCARDNKKDESPFDNGFWYCDLLASQASS